VMIPYVEEGGMIPNGPSYHRNRYTGSLSVYFQLGGLIGVRFYFSRDGFNDRATLLVGEKRHRGMTVARWVFGDQ